MCELEIDNSLEINFSNSNSFKFLKHRISNKMASDSSQNIFRLHTIETFCSSDIYSISQAHKIYRFFICCNNVVIIKLLLTNWDSLISTNGLKATRLTPVLKLSFKDIYSANSDQWKTETDEWTKRFVVERKHYEEEECNSILLALQKSNALLPDSRKMFNGMKVAMLERFGDSNT